jgi:hypothetical protein
VNGFEVGTSKFLWRHLVFVDISFKQNAVTLACEALETFLETFSWVFFEN